jgi:hypothetical protein
MQTLYSFSTAVQVSMKAVLAALVLCCQTNLIQAADNAAAIPLGCVVFKRAVDAGATFVEYRSFKDFGTNIVVINTTGDEARVFGYYEPIFIPYPSDQAADRQKALSLLQLARKTYPDMSRRLVPVEKAWAGAPLRAVLADPVSPRAKLNAGTEVVTLSGKRYDGATVTKIEPDALTVAHDAGVVRIPFSDLPEETQRKHGYDPKKTAENLAVGRKDIVPNHRAEPNKIPDIYPTGDSDPDREGRMRNAARRLGISKEEWAKSDERYMYASPNLERKLQDTARTLGISEKEMAERTKRLMELFQIPQGK